MLGEGMVKVRPKESCWGLCSYSDMRVSVNVDGFMSPSTSNAMHQSPGFQWLGTEACHKDTWQDSLKLKYFKSMNGQAVRVQPATVTIMYHEH